MKLKYLILLTLFVFSIKCSDKVSKEKENFPKIERFWMSIKEAMESKDIEFLVLNSTQKIQCGNCGIKLDSIEWFEAELFYKTYLNKIIPQLKKDYNIAYDIGGITIDKTEKLHCVNYSMKVKEEYNLLYSIIEKGEYIKFQGMFSIP